MKGEMYEADRVTRETLKNLMLVVWATALQKMFNAYSNQSHHQKALVDMWIALIISPPFIFLLKNIYRSWDSQHQQSLVVHSLMVSVLEVYTKD